MLADDFGYYAKEQTPLDRLCDAIRCDDMASFDQLLTEISELDAENGRALQACAEHDRYLMAKKLMLRGADCLIVQRHVNSLLDSITVFNERWFMHEAVAGCEKQHQSLTFQKINLERWKQEITTYAAAVATLQKVESLETQIEELRAALAELTEARQPLQIKKPPTTPQP